MSTLRTDALEGVDAKNSITIVAGSGNVVTTPIQKGLIKGFCVLFRQSDGVSGDTFNLSSVVDAAPGRLDYTHANPYIANDGYIAIPNDGNYGHAMIAPQDLTTTTAQQFSFNDSHGVQDSVHQAAFAGDLA
tara:strand:+ start:713 stop:1108 length:396 start_codon:yes stop_codon:yes gene_type:complete